GQVPVGHYQRPGRYVSLRSKVIPTQSLSLSHTHTHTHTHTHRNGDTATSAWRCVPAASERDAADVASDVLMDIKRSRPAPRPQASPPPPGPLFPPTAFLPHTERGAGTH